MTADAHDSVHCRYHCVEPSVRGCCSYAVFACVLVWKLLTTAGDAHDVGSCVSDGHC